MRAWAAVCGAIAIAGTAGAGEMLPLHWSQPGPPIEGWIFYAAGIAFHAEAAAGWPDGTEVYRAWIELPSWAAGKCITVRSYVGDGRSPESNAVRNPNVDGSGGRVGNRDFIEFRRLAAAGDPRSDLDCDGQPGQPGDLRVFSAAYGLRSPALP